MDIIYLYLINILHIIYIIFVLAVPFTNSNYLLLLHSMIVPFMLLHWYLNNNVCALTILEKYIRECITGIPVPDAESWFSNLVNPVFDLTLTNKDLEIPLYIISIGVWSISVYKLYNVWLTHKSFREFFKL